MTDPDPLVVARLEQIGNTRDGTSLIQAYLDLSTFGPGVLETIVEFSRGELALQFENGGTRGAHEAVLSALAYLGERWRDELFAALGDPRGVSWILAFTIERIDDPRTTDILLDVAGRQDEFGTSILLPALVRRRDERVLPLLERYLFSADRTLRLRAAEGLYVMGRARSAAAISAALDNERDDEVRAILADALARISDPEKALEEECPSRPQ